MTCDRKHSAGVAALLLLALAAASASAAPPPPEPESAPPWPAWLPHYELGMDLDLANHCARVLLRATWTNPQTVPTHELLFNAHSRYVVPSSEVGLTAKTLELLRVDPGDVLGVKKPACDIHQITLMRGEENRQSEKLEFRYEGDTKTTLVVPLPRAVGPGESVTVLFELTMHLPAKQGRWGQWEGVTTLSNWLPVFAYYGPPRRPANGKGPPPSPSSCQWQPTPFVPWHQPFFNEASHYRVRATLPADQQIACTGTVIASRRLDDGRQQVDINAPGVRDFAFLCSARYRVFDGFVPLPQDKPRSEPDSEDTLPPPRPLTPNPSPPSTGERGERPGVRIRVLAFPQHEFLRARWCASPRTPSLPTASGSALTRGRTSPSPRRSSAGTATNAPRW